MKTPPGARMRANLSSMNRAGPCGAPAGRVEANGASVDWAEVAVLPDRPAGEVADGVGDRIDRLEETALDGLLFHGAGPPVDDAIRLGLSDEEAVRRDAPGPGLVPAEVGEDVAAGSGRESRAALVAYAGARCGRFCQPDSWLCPLLFWYHFNWVPCNFRTNC